LQNAASVAGLIITTEASIAEAPKKDKTPAALSGADMDFKSAFGWDGCMDRAQSNPAHAVSQGKE
jgi:hypothetical protein